MRKNSAHVNHWRTVNAILGLPPYIIGSTTWIILIYAIIAEAISVSDVLSNMDLPSALRLAALPVGVILLTKSSGEYKASRLSGILLLPIPAMIVGILGDFSPPILAVVAASCMYAMLLLLNDARLDK